MKRNSGKLTKACVPLSRKLSFKFRLGSAVLIVVGLWASRVTAQETEKADTKIEKEEATSQLSPAGVKGDALVKLERGAVEKKRRFTIPPYYQEKTEKYTLRLFFPIYFGKNVNGKNPEKTLGILPFYWRHRSNEMNSDVVFPLYGRFRGPKFKTDFVLQTYYRRGIEGYHFGLIPFVFLGKNKLTDKSYQVVPPLFWRFTDKEKSFLLAGIFYLKKERENFNVGLPPLFFAGRKNYKTYSIVLPPLFFRFTDELSYKSETVVPPLFFNKREHGWSFGLMPLLYLGRDREWDKTLVAPFYWGSRTPTRNKDGEKIGETRTHIFPPLLSYYKHGPGLSQGGAAIFYQWYWNEGDYLRMYTPFVWRFGNERTMESSTLVAPLFFRKTSPVERKLMLGMLYWDFEHKHKERTVAVMPFAAHRWSLYHKDWRTWVFPTFDIGADDVGNRHFRFHPLIYYGKAPEKNHLVVAPIYWHFEDKEDDATVVFPFYWGFKDLLHEDTTQIVFPFWWRFDDPRRKNKARVAFPLYWDVQRGKKQSRLTLGMPLFWQYKLPDRKTTGFLNFVVNRGNVKGNKFWTFNLFPFLAFGHPPAPEGAYWSFLSGLVEWRRQGRSKRMKLFWIPFNLGSD